MSANKYHIDQKIYFINGFRVIKATVEEFVLHYTKAKLIKKYIVRPYGIEQTVTIDEKEIYTSLEAVKKDVLKNLKTSYTKENVRKNYEEARKNMEQKFVKEYNSFDENFGKAVENIESYSDAKFDELEKDYQENKKEKK